MAGLGALSWVATYVGMLELIEANLGDLPLIHKIIVGFSVAMLMTMIIWLLDQMFRPQPFITKLSYAAGYIFLSLILGAFTQPAALLMILVQFGAIATVTGGRGFSPPGRIGFEYNLVLIAMCLALLIEGGGMLSIDAWRASKKQPKVAAAEPVAAV